MRWIGDRESENIEDRRGGGMPMAVGGIGGLGAIIVLVVGLFLGIDPSTLMAVLNGGDPSMPQQPVIDYVEITRLVLRRPCDAAQGDPVPEALIV